MVPARWPLDDWVCGSGSITGLQLPYLRGCLVMMMGDDCTHFRRSFDRDVLEFARSVRSFWMKLKASVKITIAFISRNQIKAATHADGRTDGCSGAQCSSHNSSDKRSNCAGWAVSPRDRLCTMGPTQKKGHNFGWTPGSDFDFDSTGAHDIQPVRECKLVKKWVRPVCASIVPTLGSWD